MQDTFPYHGICHRIYNLCNLCEYPLSRDLDFRFEASMNCFYWECCWGYDSQHFSLSKFRLYLPCLIQCFYTVVHFRDLSKEMILNFFIEQTKYELVLEELIRVITIFTLWQRTILVVTCMHHKSDLRFALCFWNLNLESIWLDSGLKTFSKASNTSSGLSVVISDEEAMIWVACLPNQLINRPALCLSFRSHSGPENKMWQSALNWLNSINLSLASQSKTGLENCRPPTFDILTMQYKYSTIMTIIKYKLH